MPRYSVAKCVLPSCEIGDVGDGFGDSNNRAVTFSTVLNRPPMQQVSGPPKPESGKLRVSQLKVVHMVLQCKIFGHLQRGPCN